MPPIYKLSRTGLRLLYKIRHHKGHGIHSPFVFTLINKVIEEKAPYPAYSDIKQHIASQQAKGYKPTKYNKLCFRLVNYFEVKNILELGSGKGTNTLYLTAAAKDIVCTCVETNKEAYEQAALLYNNWDRSIVLHTDKAPILDTKQDCISINLKTYNQLPSNLEGYISSLSHSKTYLVVKNIRTNRRCQALWKDIVAMPSRTAVLDLFNVGIVFFDTKLYRWEYKISF